MEELDSKHKMNSEQEQKMSMCRVCGEKTGPSHRVYLFTPSGIANNYKNRLLAALRLLGEDPGFNIEQGDSLPDFFCLGCRARLLDFEQAALDILGAHTEGQQILQTLESGTHSALAAGPS